MTRLAVLVVAVLALALAQQAGAATFTVTSDNDVDDGTCGAHCSLREAIDDSNATAAVADEIDFSTAMTITPLTQLPSLASPVTINGTTAAGCSGAIEQIALDGNGGAFAGLLLAAGSDGSRMCFLNVRDFEAGISIGSSGNTVDGSRIGTNPAATAAPDGNSQGGIVIKAGDDNTIGGAVDAARNIISGNGGFGVAMTTNAVGNVVENNHIGLNLLGTAAVPNAGGVFVEAGSESTIGAGNVISGNVDYGVVLSGGTASGNLIGTDATGLAAIPNGDGGVLLDGPATLGGPLAGDRNIVSGNAGNQVDVEAHAPGAAVQGNWIGPDAAGDPLPTGGDAINVLLAVPTLTISDNLLAGHGGQGIASTDGVEGLVVEDNVIDGSAGGDIGIELSSDALDAHVERNTISDHGGSGIFTDADGAVVEGNTLTGNGGNGITVGPFASGTMLLGNAIDEHGGLGIDRDPDGVTPNDPGDALPDFPVLTSAVTDGTTAAIAGTLETTPGRTVAVELFSSPACDASGHGEAAVLVGALAVTTGTGPTAFSASVPATAGRQITATATDLTTQETSELSACRTVTTPIAPAPAAPAASAPPAPPPALVPVVPVPRFPAKIRVLRNGVDDGVLDMLIEVTSRAVTPGAVFSIDYESSGRHTRFTVPITGTRIKVRRKLPSTQPKDTGITTVTYAGNAIVDPDDVRVRAADGKSLLVRTASGLVAGRLTASGTVASTTRGVVRIRFSYAKPDGSTGFENWNATISGGKWSLAQTVPAGVAAGQLSIQFTGYEVRGLRGEQTAKAVP